MKRVLYIFLLIVVAACGKKTSSSKSEILQTSLDPKDLIPGTSIPEEEYTPRGLSDKIILKNGQTFAPMNFLLQNLTLTFDYKSKKSSGQSLIRFSLKETGKPYFDLQAEVKNATINSQTIEVTKVSDPDGQGQSYWALQKDLPPGVVHEVRFDFDLPAGRVSFTNGGVRFLTDMTDLSGKFFEYWGPVGFEEDAFRMNLELRVLNGNSDHNLRTNGEIKLNTSDTWKITFPDYYSKSSFYVHLTNQTTLPSKKFVYKGIEKDIPVEVYGLTQALVNGAVADLPGLFKELEGDYGAYPHDKFLAYMNDRSGGMEYVAATITSRGSLDHELLHSWFARSVIPADGRSGWIDEAMASWRDYGYSRANSVLNRPPTNLANYSAFRKSTPKNSYVDGRGLMAELSRQFEPVGGLKSVMKAFFSKYENQVINNEEFWGFLEEHTGMNLQAFNERYALGQAEMVSNRTETQIISKHPTPLTEDELQRLR